MSATGVLFVCTGNAARSVMAEAFLRRLAPGWPVASAGTLAIDGLPTSVRTTRALDALGYHAGPHRSRQVSAADVSAAGVIAVFEPYHLDYMRRHHPEAAGRTATLPRLARLLPPPDRAVEDGGGAGRTLCSRLAPLDLAGVIPEGWEEVPDPAGGELQAFHACARAVLGLVGDLAARLGEPPSR